MTLIDETISEEVKVKLDKVKSIHPFQLLFYGSKSRGDDNELSDYNFYLLANPTDQLRTSFIQEISDALEYIENGSAVSLVAGDLDSLTFRMKIFEPTAVHLCELAQVAYGKNQLESLRKEWELIRSKEIDRKVILNYLDNRCKFYKSLKSKNTKEDISRIEKVISLNLQMWIFANIEDLTPTEVCHMDIPARLYAMLKYLYKNEATDQVNILIEIYKEIHELKQTIRMTLPYSEDSLSRIKDSIQMIQGLSNNIVNKT
ncbi:MAG TPA: hypothetical protein PK079_13175 [Leptospiraceae bacterium]|nr:hypothetical protein [Leptospiraceae bacterium]HMX31864.1 hypothetical protein [Leptospiraceae bacterium]HMY29731.1 hypothetical protein [Leptospiraceae bacterium]HMZ62870.1 hypothetical protein [Leptospiraceae bacterium]HNA07898.1 hypothetical protein [Leptospiraceae bacterium]